MKQPYPVIKLKPWRASEKLIQWVAAYGLSRLARSLSVSRSAVHAWVTQEGKQRCPGREIARSIVALSKIEPLQGNIRLTLSDVLGESDVDKVEIRK